MSKTTTTTKATTTTTEATESLHLGFVTAMRDVIRARRALIKAIKAAKDGNVAEAKGFASWSDYATSVVESTLPKSTPKAEREMIAVILAHFGVSQRDAAKATEVSQPTVSRRVKAKATEVAAEVAEATGVASDAKAATTTTTKAGTEVARDAKRGKGREAKATTEATPKAQPKRTPNALATDAMTVIEGAWHNLTDEQRVALFDRMGELFATHG